MGRWLAFALLIGLLVLDAGLPATGIGRRGTDLRTRQDVPVAGITVGAPFPDLALRDPWGVVVRPAELQGHRVVLTFERSVDW